MTREEYINQIKDRAKKEYEYYLTRGGHKEATRNAISNIISDLGKHPETNNQILKLLCMQKLISNNLLTSSDFYRFINGFN